jgi:hypothetical protein
MVDESDMLILRPIIVALLVVALMMTAILRAHCAGGREVREQNRK